jgi:hypothetical protein
MIVAIHQGDVRPVARESLAKRKPAKARPHHDNARPA